MEKQDSSRAWLVVGLVVVVVSAVALAPSVGAYPTCLDLMPTADLAGARTVCLQVEADGHDTPFSPGTGVHLFTEVGVTDWLEIGADLTDLNGEVEPFLDAKVLLAAETARTPALSVGIYTLGDPGPAQVYLALAKQAGDFRAHTGLTTDGTARGMFGLEWAAGERTAVLADWVTGPEAYHTLGVCQDLGGGFGGLLYYARSNTAATEDFVGLNVAWEGSW